MMQKLRFLYFLVSFSGLVQAQNFMMYRPWDETVYQRQGVNELFAINFDSAYYGGTFDILGYPKHFFHPYYGCDSVGYFGKRVFMSHIEGSIFTNKWDKNITLLHWKHLGESWMAYGLGGGDSIEASVISVIPVHPLSTDSIKTIRFSAKNSQGQGIHHPVNGSEIKISSDRGMVHFPDFGTFPYHADSFQYYSHNAIGFTANFGFEETFDFSPGDVFHYRERSYPSGGQPSSTFDHHLIKVTIQFQISNDTVYHSFARWYHQTFTDPFNNTSIQVTIDTVTEQFVASDYPFLKSSTYELSYHTSTAAGQGVTRFLIDSGTFALFPASIEKKAFGFNFYVDYDSILSGKACVTLTGNPAEYSADFARGLGRIRAAQGHMPVIKDSVLVFFRKGSLSWGDSIEWDNLPMGLQALSESIPMFQIFPNPVGDEAIVKTSAPIRQINVFDTQGANVRATATKRIDNEWAVDFSSLPKGIYVVGIQTNDGILHQRLVK